MSNIEKFAAAVSAYELWLMKEKDQGISLVLTASKHITNLYQHALELKFEGDDNDLSVGSMERISDKEYRNAVDSLSRLPLRYYSEVFETLVVPPESPVTGDLVDDLADIYSDTVSSLRAYQSGNVKEAVWNWEFNFHSHWGEHATSAIRCLYWYRREHYMNLC